MATTPTPVSPKIKSAALWGALSGIALTALTAVTTSLDPHIFDFLGAWGGVVYSAVITGAASLAGWLTKDQLREYGQQQVDAARLSNQSVGANLAADVPLAPALEESALPNAGTFAAPSITDKE